MKISFDEIDDWEEFEDLATSYFEKVCALRNDAHEVVVQPSGGPGDGGRDILVTLRVNDSFSTFERRWVVQCKFHEQDINKKLTSDLNIPSLLEEHNANGYLLICKKRATNPLVQQFEGFQRNNTIDRGFKIWTGSQFLDKIQEHDDLVKRYFPKYHNARSNGGQLEDDFESKYAEFSSNLTDTEKR